MTLESRLADELLCMRTVTRMNNAFDRGDAATGLGHYAEDARWERPDGTLSGLAAITRYYAERPANAVICHVLTNMEVDLTGADTAVCRYYSQGFREVFNGAPRQPLPMSGAGVLWRYHDSLRRIDGQWKVTARRADRIYDKGA